MEFFDDQVKTMTSCNNLEQNHALMDKFCFIQMERETYLHLALLHPF